MGKVSEDEARGKGRNGDRARRSEIAITNGATAGKQCEKRKNKCEKNRKRKGGEVEDKDSRKRTTCGKTFLISRRVRLSRITTDFAIKTNNKDKLLERQAGGHWNVGVSHWLRDGETARVLAGKLKIVWFDLEESDWIS